jgi:hypothetical protein
MVMAKKIEIVGDHYNGWDVRPNWDHNLEDTFFERLYIAFCVASDVNHVYGEDAEIVIVENTEAYK